MRVWKKDIAGSKDIEQWRLILWGSLGKQCQSRQVRTCEHLSKFPSITTPDISVVCDRKYGSRRPHYSVNINNVMTPVKSHQTSVLQYCHNGSVHNYIIFFSRLTMQQHYRTFIIFSSFRLKIYPFLINNYQALNLITTRFHKSSFLCYNKSIESFWKILDSLVTVFQWKMLSIHCFSIMCT